MVTESCESFKTRTIFQSLWEGVISLQHGRAVHEISMKGFMTDWLMFKSFYTPSGAWTW